jgi:hypothetical protein
MKKIYILIMIIFLICCKTIDINLIKAPKVIRIETGIFDMGNNSFENDNITAKLCFKIIFDDYNYISNISSFKITDPTGAYWIWNKEEINKSFNKDTKKLEFDWCGTSFHPHYIALGGYLAEIFNNDDVSTKFNFTIYGNNDLRYIKGNLYSHESNENDKILTIPKIIKAERDNDNLIIEFEVIDNNINDAFLFFYENNNYLDISQFLSTIKPIEIGINNYTIKLSDKCKKANYLYLIYYSKRTSTPNIVTYRSLSDKIKF